MRVALVFLLFAGCAPAPEGKGVVSLLPAWTEILVALDADLIACTEHCVPGRDVPRIDWQDPRSAEEIVRLAPAVVYKQKRRVAHDPLAAALRASGVRVVELPSESIADLRAAFVEIGGDEGRALRDRFDAELEAAIVQPKERPKVLFVYNRSPGVVAHIGAAGPGSFLDEMLTLAGGENALKDAAQPYVQLDLERLVRSAPDVVIDNLPPEDDPAAVWRKSPLRDAKVRFVTDNRMLVPGPRLPDAVRRLAELIHGDA